MGIFSSPKKIDEQKIREFMTSKYTGQLDSLGAQLMDPNSVYNQQALQQATSVGLDNAYQQNRMNRMNMAASGMGGQSGILQAQANQNIGQATGSVQQAWMNNFQNRLQQRLGIMQANQQIDSKIGEAQASAYGQNITNKNNHNAAMAGNVMGLASTALMMCDARMKENIKKVGVIKLKNGKKTGVYEFNYKGRDKKHTNVMAQDLEKVMPDAVFKGKNGLKYVDTRKLV
tara:strand:- start:1647 stop:2336 length:690 start_codon:yes stop_codon:yes gene_type:complete